MSTFQLNPATWDLMAVNGRIAIATGPNALAQDVASAISTFLGELYYDTTQGIPWLREVFGQDFSPSLISALLVQATLTVPGVVSSPAPKVANLVIVNRKVTGTVNFTDVNGEALGVTF